MSKNKGKGNEFLGDQIKQAVDEGAFPQTSSTIDPPKEADGYADLFGDLPTADDIMPEVDEVVVARETAMTEALLKKVRALAVDYTEKVWPIRIQSESARVARKGYTILSDRLHEILCGRLVKANGSLVKLDQEKTFAVMLAARRAYTETAIPLVVRLAPGNRGVFFELLGDLIKYDVVREPSVAELSDRSIKKGFFGKDDASGNSRVFVPFSKEDEYALDLLIGAWNTGIREEERGEFKKRTADLKARAKKIPMSELDSKSSIGKQVFLFVPAWDGKDRQGKVVKKDGNPALALLVEVVEKGCNALKIVDLVSTNPQFEAHVKALADSGVYVPTSWLQEKEFPGFAKRVNKDFFNKVKESFQLLRSGFLNESKNEKRASAWKEFTDGAIDIVDWYGNSPEGDVVISFRPWKEKRTDGEISIDFSVRLKRLSSEGRKAPILLEDFTPRWVGEQKEGDRKPPLPHLGTLIGKQFVPTGGDKFEGNVSPNVPTEAALFFRRMLSAGFTISRHVLNSRKRKAAEAEETVASSDGEATLASAATA